MVLTISDLYFIRIQITFKVALKPVRRCDTHWRLLETVLLGPNFKYSKLHGMENGTHQQITWLTISPYGK